MVVLSKVDAGSSISRLPRQCRAYFKRTNEVVGFGRYAWECIFSRKLPLYDPDCSTCGSLFRYVKDYLSLVVSESEDEQMAFQSIKKMLPDSCHCMEEDMLEKLCDGFGRRPIRLPKGYAKFCRRELTRIFYPGWDRDYESFCVHATPPIKATMESSRAEGGALGHFTGVSQSEYLAAVLSLENRPDLPTSVDGKAVVVQSSGKPRALVTYEAAAFLLKPLHKTIYSRLSREKWLLRGPPTPSKLRDAGFRYGASLISGDYRSATDNLPIEIAELILEVALRATRHVPLDLCDLAYNSLRPRVSTKAMLETGQKPLELRVGQMMGAYLSFPLLCLQNYLAFRYACSLAGIEGTVPVLINGDDILFQHSSLFEKWKTVVSSVGLEVEPTKTSVSVEFGMINSTLLVWSDGFLVVKPTFRLGLLRRADYPHSLGKSFQDFVQPACDPRQRFNAGRVFFERHVGLLRSCRWSLTSLGFRGTLALRFSQIFRLDLGRLEGSLPQVPRQHDVVVPPDFVLEVPIDAVDTELRSLSACEMGAWKWAHGWRALDRDVAVIGYYNAMTVYSRCPVVCEHKECAELGMGLYNGMRIIGRESRKERLKRYTLPVEKRSTCRIFSNLLDLEFLLHVLPSYDERPLLSVDETDVWNEWLMGRIVNGGGSDASVTGCTRKI
nr:MAG: putative RNA-dependent RNA polymerase [Botourmiaviridae sp.]